MVLSGDRDLASRFTPVKFDAASFMCSQYLSAGIVFQELGESASFLFDAKRGAAHHFTKCVGECQIDLENGGVRICCFQSCNLEGERWIVLCYHPTQTVISSK